MLRDINKDVRAPWGRDNREVLPSPGMKDLGGGGGGTGAAAIAIRKE